MEVPSKKTEPVGHSPEKDNVTTGMPDLTPAPTTITNPVVNRPPPPLVPRPHQHTSSSVSSDAHYSQPRMTETSKEPLLSSRLQRSGFDHVSPAGVSHLIPIHMHSNSSVNPREPMAQQHRLGNTPVISYNTGSFPTSNTIQTGMSGVHVLPTFPAPALLQGIPPAMTRMAPVTHSPVPLNIPRVSTLPAQPIQAPAVAEKKSMGLNYMQPLSQIQPRAPSVQVPPPAHSPVSIDSMSLVATGQAVDMTKRTSPRSANVHQEEKGMDLSKNSKDYVAPVSVVFQNPNTMIESEDNRERKPVSEEFTGDLSIDTNPHEGIRYTDEISPNSRLEFVPTVDEASLPPLNFTPEESPGEELSEMDRRVRDKAKRVKKPENEDVTAPIKTPVKCEAGQLREKSEIFTQPADNAVAPVVKTSVRFTEGQYMKKYMYV